MHPSSFFLASEVFFFSDLFGLCRIPLMPMLSLKGVRLSKLVSAEPWVGGGYGPIFDDGGDSRDAHQGLNQPFPTHIKKKKNSKRFSLETMPQFPPHRHHVPPIKFQTHSPPISPFLPWSIQNKNIPLRPLAKGHTWSLFFFSGGQEEIPHTPEIWSLSRQATARLVLAPALASTAARGPTHRLRTNGIGYP